MLKKIIIFFALFLLSCSDAKLELGKSAPEILAKSTAGEKIKLKRSGIEIIQFWENGCAACLKVMADLNDFAIAQDIKIYAINSIDSLATIKKHESENAYTGILFLKDLEDISWSRYELFAVPTLFIIKDGIFMEKILGERGFKYIESKIKAYL